MLVAFTYTPSFNGAQINSAIQAACKGKEKALPTLGVQTWKTILNILYTDFNSILKASVFAYISQATCLFPVAPPSPLVIPPPDFSLFNGLIASTAATINTQIQTQAKALQPSKNYDAMGKLVWEIFLTFLFTDMITVIPIGIANACNMGVVIVNPGALAAPTIGTIAPVPATLVIPYVPATLMGLMQSTFNAATAKQMASSIYNQIKTSMQALPLQAMGPQMWNIFCTEFTMFMMTKFHIHIQQYLVSTQNFSVTIGTPGIIPGVPPTVGPTASPALGIIS